MTRFVWLPAGLIDLETVLERVVAAKHGAAFIAQWTQETLRDEYEAQPHGGVRTRAWEDARAWVLRHLQQGLLLFKVSKADPPVIRTHSAEFWRSPDHADRQRQRFILDRRGDPSGISTYAVNEVHFMALLDAEFGNHARSPQDASYIAASGSTSPVVPKPESEAAAQNFGRPGRKKGSGAKDDAASLRAMLDLLADGRVPSVLAAARSFIANNPHSGDNEAGELSWAARLHRKFRAQYGTQPPSGQTWDQVRRTADV